MILENVKEVEIRIFLGVTNKKNAVLQPSYGIRRFHNVKELVIGSEWVVVKQENNIFMYNKKPIAEILIKK